MAPPLHHATFTIDAVALACHQVYAQGDKNALRQDGVIAYEESQHGAVAEPMLFYGPYVEMAPGVYLLTFRGSLHGVLSVDFARDFGESFREVSLEDFSSPVCLVVTTHIAKFEIRGRKTPLLKSMRLEAIDVERVYAERAP